MRDRRSPAFLLVALVAGPASVGAEDLTSLLWPKEHDTLAASNLPPAQVRELLDQADLPPGTMVVLPEMFDTGGAR